MRLESSSTGSVGSLSSVLSLELLGVYRLRRGGRSAKRNSSLRRRKVRLTDLLVELTLGLLLVSVLSSSSDVRSRESGGSVSGCGGDALLVDLDLLLSY